MGLTKVYTGIHHVSGLILAHENVHSLEDHS